MHSQNLIIINLTIFIISGIIIVINLTAAPDDVKSNVCYSKACYETASFIIDSMNQSIDPCEDFYEFVCGSPKSSSKLLIINYYIIDKLYNLAIGISEESPGYLRKLRQYFKTCMDEEQLDETSDLDLKKVLDDLGGWPVLDKKNLWNETEFKWTDLVHKFRKTGFSVNYFIEFSIGVDLKNNSKRVIYLDQPRLSIDREYLIQGLNSSIVRAYKQFMIDVAKIFGANDDVEEELEESLKFEIELAKLCVPAKERYDIWKLYRTTSISELDSSYPIAHWQDYLNNILSPYARVEGTELVHVLVPGYFRGLAGLLGRRRALANYGFWRAIFDSADQLSGRVRVAKAQFEAILLGSSMQVDRGLECAWAVSRYMYLAMGALYVRKHFDDRLVQPVTDMAENIRASLRAIIQQTDWMDDNIKNRVLEKVSWMNLNIAYPNELLDDTKLDDYYKDLDVHDEKYFVSSLKFNQFELKREIESLKKSYNKSDWTEFYGNAAKSNAFYIITNAMYLPAGMMHELLYHRDIPNYMNYAMLGQIIGHEMAHALSTQARFFNEHGNFDNWWDSESSEKYLNKTKCIVEKYSNYKYKHIEIAVNGETTLNENMADIGGLKAAYLAYDKWQRSQEEEEEEPRLPGFESYTPRQMFWMTYGSSWCNDALSQSNIQDSIITDEHTPERFRVIGSVSSLPEFARDFNCRPRDLMNPQKRCAMW